MCAGHRGADVNGRVLRLAIQSEFGDGRREPLAYLFNMLLNRSVRDLGPLIRENECHFLLSQAVAEDFQSVLRALTVGQLFFPRNHVEQVHLVGILKAAHRTRALCLDQGVR